MFSDNPRLAAELAKENETIAEGNLQSIRFWGLLIRALLILWAVGVAYGSSLLIRRWCE